MRFPWWCRLLDFLRVQWKTYKVTLCWLVFWLVVGAVFGVITLIMGDVGAEDINYNLIDGNLLNATSLGPSIGNFIWQRVLSVAIPILIVLICALIAKWTTIIIFPLVFMHGYWLCVAVWWTFFYYSFSAILLLAFYIVWLLLVTAVLLAGMLWALQWGSQCRTARPPHAWWSMFRGFAILVGVAVVLGFCEYLVFWAILGKIVYKPL